MVDCPLPRRGRFVSAYRQQWWVVVLAIPLCAVCSSLQVRAWTTTTMSPSLCVRSRNLSIRQRTAKGRFETTSDTATEEEEEVNKLSKQERIIQALNLLPPESPSERASRMKARADVFLANSAQKRRNLGLALLSSLVAVLNYLFQYLHPVSAIQLLSKMQEESSSVTVIGRNDRPTVVDFWAPWCENCRAFAPTLYGIERDYADRINFVMINADADDGIAIDRFGVDAIPHMALIDKRGNVLTALIGPVPASILQQDLNTLLQDDYSSSSDDKQMVQLPHVMFDAFQNKPELRQVHF